MGGAAADRGVVADAVSGRPARRDSLWSDEEPEAEVVARETIELAFIAAIQFLPPKQRAVLILRDVLGWRAAPSASLLDLSVAATNGALQRARATLQRQLPRQRLEWGRSAEVSEEERALLERYMEAAGQNDPDAMIRLLREDAVCAMEPISEWSPVRRGDHRGLGGGRLRHGDGR